VHEQIARELRSRHLAGVEGLADVADGEADKSITLSNEDRFAYPLVTNSGDLAAKIQPRKDRVREVCALSNAL
jgi:hypothetical protein